MIQDKPKSVNNPSFEVISQFLKNPYYFIPVRIFFIILGLSFLLLGITFHKLPPVVPLYYSLPWGEEQLGKSTELFLIPFSLIVIFILNFIINILFLKKDYFLGQILFWSTSFIALLGLITLFKIIFLIS